MANTNRNIHLSMGHLASLLILPLLASPLSSWAQDPTIDRLIASQCAQCHGTNGNATGDIDRLAGKETGDLYDKLIDMIGEDRPEDVMDHQALGYTNEQLYRIARYYSTLPESSGDHESDDD